MEGSELRTALADLADVMADVADEFAGILERSATRGDAVRRLRTAGIERQIAQIQRRNARRMREDRDDKSVGLYLEPLPTLRTGSPAPSDGGPDRI
jgi:hypothetical protein